MALPDELRNTPQWLVSGSDKAPRSPKTGKLADVRDRNLYASYTVAQEYAQRHGMDVGFALTPEDPYTVIDLDAPTTGEERERHQKIFELFDTYSELSKSGAGLHIWCLGRLPRGVRRDSVEVYPHSRYIICTGNTVRDVPIRDTQDLLETLYHEISGNGNGVVTTLVDREAILDDADIFEMAINAANGDKFDRLCRGEWQVEYPSQSEADYALMNMFCFYTKSNEQAIRLFRMSALGKRAKAQREKYLEYMIQKIRAEEPPPIDFSKLQIPPKPPLVVPVPSEEKLLNGRQPGQKTDEYPPGFLGQVAQYITETSIRPVREVGIAAALSLCAGVVGRQFNISGTGLNQYIILLAKTGAGKEGAAAGINRIIAACRTIAPVVDAFIGPASFASGQGLIRALDEQLSFVAILGEFGLMLQDLSDPKADPVHRTMRRVLLDLYTKSGRTEVVNPTVYSDKQRNTKKIFAPAVTLLGESTPELFFAGLSQQHIADGLIPRFLVIEYTGQRPPKNPTPFAPPSEAMIKRFAQLIEVALRMQGNNTWYDVQLDDDARAILDEFDIFCDTQISEGGNEGIRQLWNRAHLKALRLSALLAVCDRPHNPSVNAIEAEWAVRGVTEDTLAMSTRFESGDVGAGDTKQLHDLNRVLKDYTTYPIEKLESYGVTAAMRDKQCVPYVYMQRRTVGLSAFRNHKNGARAALRESIGDLVAGGKLRKVPPQIASKMFDTTAEMYFLVQI